MDREKVISGLHCKAQDLMIDPSACDGCDYQIQMVNHMGCDYRRLCRNALALLKEQEAVEWINVKDKLPEKDGKYLVVYTFFNCKDIGVVRFTHNLHKIDEYIFDTENRPGWYESDDEVGYFEMTTVTHWAKLPAFPKEGQ